MLLLKIILSERLSSDKGISTRLTPLSEDNHPLCKKIAKGKYNILPSAIKEAQVSYLIMAFSQTSLFFLVRVTGVEPAAS